jgi:predicted N-acetyltransferase YhbS
MTKAQTFESYSCGNPTLDGWLRTGALHAQSMRTARTFVWHRGDKVVIGYFSLAAHLVWRADVPGRVGRGGADAIPAILLARLALDSQLHGEGLGAELLWDALSRCVAASDAAGARVVVVDAIDDAAAAFYARFGFRAPTGQPLRLFQKVSDVAAALQSRR